MRRVLAGIWASQIMRDSREVEKKELRRPPMSKLGLLVMCAFWENSSSSYGGRGAFERTHMRDINVLSWKSHVTSFCSFSIIRMHHTKLTEDGSLRMS
jgi:hypothetical protein